LSSYNKKKKSDKAAYDDGVFRYFVHIKRVYLSIILSFNKQLTIIFYTQDELYTDIFNTVEYFLEEGYEPVGASEQRAAFNLLYAFIHTHTSTPESRYEKIDE
jgi:hypothetical protein